MTRASSAASAIALLATSLFAAGCYTMNAELPGTLRPDLAATDVEPVGSFSIEKSNTFFFWGLAGVPTADFFASDLRREVAAKRGDGVQNLTWESQFGCIDLLLGRLTCGLISPRTYKLSGEVVRIKAAALPGAPPSSPSSPSAPSPSPSSPSPRKTGQSW